MYTCAAAAAAACRVLFYQPVSLQQVEIPCRARRLSSPSSSSAPCIVCEYSSRARHQVCVFYSSERTIKQHACVCDACVRACVPRTARGDFRFTVHARTHAHKRCCTNATTCLCSAQIYMYCISSARRTTTVKKTHTQRAGN